jgi:gamma-glutamyltranspeptidase/glutathione hydrolase
LIDYAMAPRQAVAAPRLHHRWLPDELDAEPFAHSPDAAARLGALGYRMATQSPWGAAELIAVGPGAALSGGMRPGLPRGGNDSRRPAGSAEGC